MTRVSLIITCLVFFLGMSAGAERQPETITKPYPQPDLQTANDKDLLRLARRMMKTTDYQGASGLLELVYERQPANTVVTNLLRQCYDRQGMYPNSELLIRRLLEAAPDNFSLNLFLAENLAYQTDTAGSSAAYQRVLELIDQKNPSLFQSIVRSMERNGFAAEALQQIMAARARNADQSLLALDAGRILEGLQRYRESSEEYFVALDDTSRAGIEAETRLLNLLAFVGADSDLEATLLDKIGTAPQARAARLLSTHCLKTDRAQQAFGYALLQDSLEGGTGRPLLRFIRACQERRLYAEVALASQEALALYGGESVFEECYFIYADALVHLGQHEAAIAVYDSIVAHFPREQDKAHAGYQIGNIYLNSLNDYPTALAIFDSVAAHYRSGNSYMNSVLAAPHCLLRQGNLDGAQFRFKALSTKTFGEDAMESIHYHLGLIKFLQGAFDSSRADFNRLLVTFPRGFYVNDALGLMLLIDEAAEAPDLLKQYASFLIFDLKRRPDSAIGALEGLATAADPTLADVALHKLSQISLSQPDTAAAIGYVNRLEEFFPESYYLPYGLKLKADILLENADSIDSGKEIYRQLLESYPNYPFISDVRKRLRQLEEDTQTS